MDLVGDDRVLIYWWKYIYFNANALARTDNTYIKTILSRL